MTSLNETAVPAKTAVNDALSHFEREINSGKHWYLALLETIGLWTVTEERVDERYYRYVINGEIFDWLELAERICRTKMHLLPETEVNALLFHAVPPVKLGQEEFCRIIGQGKFLQHLNFFYGVTVESFLILTAREEVRKSRHAAIVPDRGDHDIEVYRSIYGMTESALYKRFLKERDYPNNEVIGLTILKEFTYWLFKYRLQHSDPSRVASDTKKALEYFRKQLRGRWAEMIIPC